MSLLDDVNALKDKPLPEVREAIAEKIATYFDKGTFDGVENDLACDIIRMLARDVELRVRKTLAESLKNSSILPRDVALKMANDVLEVSLPILEFSKVLTDEDIVEIIRSTKQVAKHIAIAKRHNASEIISAELVKLANEDVVVSLFANGSAKISQGSLEFAFNEFKTSGKVVGALINRGDLAISVVEKILNAVSAEVREELVRTHQLDARKAESFATAAQERVTLGLLDDVDSGNGSAAQTSPAAEKQESLLQIKKSTQTENLVNHLLKEGRLTDSLILRSLCEGNMLFFEVSMARRAGIPIMNARVLMRDGNAAALKSLWRRSKLPDSAFEAMNVVINFAVKCPKEMDRVTFSRNLLEYVHEKGYDKTTPLMRYVMALVASGVRVRDII